jgi:hypothetical protein
MNSKSTWVWITIAALLFAAVFAVEKFGNKPPPALVALLPGFRAAAVTSVQFVPAGQLEIRAERTNGTWRLVKPITYPAQAASIEALLAALQQLALSHTISGAEERQHKNAAEEFGFAPRTTLTLTSGDEPKQLLIGSRTAHGDQIYVKVVGVEGVFVVDAQLLLFLPATPNQWRDTALVDLRGLAFDRIVVSNETVALQLQRATTNSPWRLINPIPARADNKRLDESLQKLQTTRVQSFVTDDATADGEVFGFHSPELELALAQGTNLLVALQFGKSPTNDSTLIYARRSGQPSVVTVERQALDLWRAAKLNDFRDPHLVTLTGLVEEIEVTGAAAFTLQHPDNSPWRLGGSDLPIDAGLVAEFLQTFSGAPILDYKDSITPSDLPKYGLAEPTRQIILRARENNGRTNPPLAEIAVGDVKDELVYVQRADEKNSVYALGIVDYGRLLAAPWRFRERQLWRFSETNAVRLTLQRGDRKSELRRVGANSWAFAPGSQGLINGAEVEKTVQRFGNLNAEGWLGRGEADRARLGFTTNHLVVTIELKDGTKHEVGFCGTAPDGYPYAEIKLDGETWFFEFPLAPYKFLEFTLLNPAAFPP